MTKFVDNNELSGWVTMVVSEDEILHQSAAGYADIASQSTMKIDSLFWIASMSKPVTATAVLILVDEGKLRLDDPISKYLPEMKGLRDQNGDPVTITIQQLLSHTSGMPELGAEAYLIPTLQHVAKEYAKLDVLFTPGSKWQYSQTSINTAARIVEVVSGQKFDPFVAQRIFEPLGMVDTTFYLSDAQLQRLANSYRKEGTELKPVAVRILNGKSPTSRDRFPAGNGGLFSTAPDYAKFCQMLLGGGKRGDVRILTSQSVETMCGVVTGDLTTGFTPGNAWGIGVCVVRQPQGVSEALSPGSFGHGGAYGTQAWIDPTLKLAYILMIQRSDLPNSDASAIRRDFQNAARAALVE